MCSFKLAVQEEPTMWEDSYCSLTVRQDYAACAANLATECSLHFAYTADENLQSTTFIVPSLVALHFIHVDCVRA